jgi:Tfp pilus assembly protein PilN
MALRDINLIPAEILTHRLGQRHLCFWAACLLVSLGLIFGFFFYQKHVIIGQKSNFANLQHTHTHLGLKIKEIEKIKQELEKLDHQQTVLRDIIRGPICSQVLWKLADIINENTWLTSLATDNNRHSEENASIKLNGYSISNEELGNFLSQLSLASIFQNVRLKYAQEALLSQSNRGDDASIKVIQFEIECKLLTG